MLRFQHQEYFIFLLFVALSVLVYFSYTIWRKKKIQRLGKPSLVADLMPSYSAPLHKIKFTLTVIALFFGIVGLANLQKRGKLEKITQQGIDVVIALDVSNSMYARDLNPSRMEKARLFADKLIDKLSGNRIGLILFAGKSYLSVPLTTDIAALKMNLSLANPENLPTQGTVIGDALQMAYESFNSKDAKHKAIVLISDGEDHDEKAIKEAKRIGKKGIMLCTVGVGSEAGSTIPLPNGENKKDRDGNEVLSKMNEKELKAISDAGQGVYVNLDNVGNNVRQVANRLDQIGKTNLGESQLAHYDSYFQYFLAIMLLLLIIEFFLPGRKSGKRLRTAFHTMVLFMLPQFLQAQTILDKNIADGNNFYKQQQYEQAAAAYQKTLTNKKAQTKEPARFNLGNALLGGQQKDAAIKQFEYVGARSKDKKLSAFAYHNAGNVKASEQQWQEAINYYKASLRKNPNSPETKYNLAYAQKKLKEQQQQQDKKDQNKENKPDQQDKQEKPKPDDKGQPKQDNKEEEKQKPQPQASKLSKEQAEKLLDALNREEKKVKDGKEKGKAASELLEKDW